MERLVFIPVGLAIAILTSPFHLTYFAFAIVVGLAITLLDFMWGNKEAFDPQFGYWSLATGLVCLVVAYYLSNDQGITFDEMVNDKTFPKLLRRLPYFGVAFLTIGTVIVIKSIFRKREP